MEAAIHDDGHVLFTVCERDLLEPNRVEFARQLHRGEVVEPHRQDSCGELPSPNSGTTGRSASCAATEFD